MTSFYQRFLGCVREGPECPAVEMQRLDGTVDRVSYAELRRQAESVARWLEESRIERGARCAILAANGPRWVAAYLGVQAAGGVAVPLDTAFNPTQIAKLLRDSGSALLFCDARNLDAAQQAAALAPELKIKLTMVEGARANGLPHLDEMLATVPGKFAPAERGPDDTAVLLYTSGTTSDPKGVMLSQRNLEAEHRAVFQIVKVTPHDAVLSVLPLFHALAQMANLLLPLAVGARVVYLESLNTGELLRALRERGITLFCCVPQFYYLIHERVMKQVEERGWAARTLFRLLLRTARVLRGVNINAGKVFFRKAHRMLGPAMRYFITGGSRFDAKIGRDLEALGFDILQAYGLTECSGCALCTPPHANVMGSVGQPLPGVELRIADPQPADEPSGPASGEIALRGEIVMKGYYNRPEATAEVIREGWLYTGDLGYRDARGNVYISGRKKDVIVLSSGKNIYPEEIEGHYLQSPFIKEICVMGVESRPGEPFSERLHAVVVPNLDVLRERKIVNLKAVIRFDIENLSAQLPGAKRILSYEIWQHELPRTTTRKLKRFAIQKEAAARKGEQESAAVESQAGARTLTDADREWLATPDVARAVALIRRRVKKEIEAVHPEDNLELDLGFDSMERVELLVALERELGAHVEDSVVSEVYNVRELAEAVRAGIGREGTRAQAGWESIFATESTDPEVLAVTKSRPLSVAWWYLFGRTVKFFLLKVLFRLEIRGLEKLPATGPFIICPNHQSYLDPVGLVSSLPWHVVKDVFYVGTSEIFGSGPMRLLARSLKLVPVDPDANLVPAMRAGAYGLRHGKILVLYPEGERSITGEPRTFRKGAAILATHLQVPIVPAAHEGFYEAWPRAHGFRKFAKLTIEFGGPMPPRPLGADPEKTYAEVTEELRSRVVAMWKPLHEQQHGVATEEVTGRA